MEAGGGVSGLEALQRLRAMGWIVDVHESWPPMTAELYRPNATGASGVIGISSDLLTKVVEGTDCDLLDRLEAEFKALGADVRRIEPEPEDS